MAGYSHSHARTTLHSALKQQQLFPPTLRGSASVPLTPEHEPMEPFYDEDEEEESSVYSNVSDATIAGGAVVANKMFIPKFLLEQEQLVAENTRMNGAVGGGGRYGDRDHGHHQHQPHPPSHRPAGGRRQLFKGQTRSGNGRRMHSPPATEGGSGVANGYCYHPAPSKSGASQKDKDGSSKPRRRGPRPYAVPRSRTLPRHFDSMNIPPPPPISRDLFVPHPPPPAGAAAADIDSPTLSYTSDGGASSASDSASASSRGGGQRVAKRVNTHTSPGQPHAQGIHSQSSYSRQNPFSKVNGSNSGPPPQHRSHSKTTYCGGKGPFGGAGAAASMSSLPVPLAPINIGSLSSAGPGATSVVSSAASTPTTSQSRSKAMRILGAAFDEDEDANKSAPSSAKNSLKRLKHGLSGRKKGDGSPDIVLPSQFLRFIEKSLVPYLEENTTTWNSLEPFFREAITHCKRKMQQERNLANTVPHPRSQSRLGDKLLASRRHHAHPAATPLNAFHAAAHAAAAADKAAREQAAPSMGSSFINGILNQSQRVFFGHSSNASSSSAHHSSDEPSGGSNNGSGALGAAPSGGISTTRSQPIELDRFMCGLKNPVVDAAELVDDGKFLKFAFAHLRKVPVRSTLPNPGEWFSQSQVMFKARGRQMRSIDAAIARYYRTHTLVNKLYERSKIIFHDAQVEASQATIEFSYSGFERCHFSVGQYSVLNAWDMFLENSSNCAWGDAVWENSLHSSNPAKELMQSAPDMTQSYTTRDPDEIRRAKTIMQHVQLSLFHNLTLSSFMLNREKELVPGESLSWPEVVDDLPNRNNEKKHKIFDKLTYLFHPTDEQIEHTLNTLTSHETQSSSAEHYLDDGETLATGIVCRPIHWMCFHNTMMTIRLNRLCDLINAITEWMAQHSREHSLRRSQRITAIYVLETAARRELDVLSRHLARMPATEDLVAASSLRGLAKNREAMNRFLRNRPNVEQLINRGVLPRDFDTYDLTSSNPTSPRSLPQQGFVNPNFPSSPTNSLPPTPLHSPLSISADTTVGSGTGVGVAGLSPRSDAGGLGPTSPTPNPTPTKPALSSPSHSFGSGGGGYRSHLSPGYTNAGPSGPLPSPAGGVHPHRSVHNGDPFEPSDADGPRVRPSFGSPPEISAPPLPPHSFSPDDVAAALAAARQRSSPPPSEPPPGAAATGSAHSSPAAPVVRSSSKQKLCLKKKREPRSRTVGKSVSPPRTTALKKPQIHIETTSSGVGVGNESFASASPSARSFGGNRNTVLGASSKPILTLKTKQRAAAARSHASTPTASSSSASSSSSRGPTSVAALSASFGGSGKHSKRGGRCGDASAGTSASSKNHLTLTENNVRRVFKEERRRKSSADAYDHYQASTPTATGSGSHKDVGSGNGSGRAGGRWALPLPGRRSRSSTSSSDSTEGSRFLGKSKKKVSFRFRRPSIGHRSSSGGSGSGGGSHHRRGISTEM